MLQLWTTAKLQRLDFSLRRKLGFYAPLLESLDFWGVDPVTYTRSGTTSAAHRRGSVTLAANVPPFEYDGELPLGVFLASGATLQFSSQNGLNDANTLIWFEDDTPMSTPTDSNPFDSNGIWTGNLSVNVKHIVKARWTLSNTEINTIQEVLEDVVQEIPLPPPPPASPVGSPITETPVHQGGGVYLLSQDPDLGSLQIFSHGGLYIERVGANPGNLQYTIGGAGNRTVTMGMTPSPTTNIVAVYFVAEA